MAKRKTGPLEMRLWGDPALRVACTPVGVVTDDLRRLAVEMLETMYNANGVGLAAPQVGRTERLCVIDAEANAAIPMPLVMVNPEILAREGEQTDEEGCLSFPSIHLPVTRANRVSFTFVDAEGKRQTHTAFGLLARAVQHELEHLDGGVFIDNVADKAPIAAKLDKLEAKTKRRLGLG